MNFSRLPILLLGTIACGSYATPRAVQPASSDASATATENATTGPITAADLRHRMYIFADDSMMGRRIGTWGNHRAINYLAEQLGEMGVEPGGEEGFFQDIPLYTRSLGEGSALSLGDRSFNLGEDWIPIPPIPQLAALSIGDTGDLDGIPVVYGGIIGDAATMISPEEAAGKLVIVAPQYGPDGNPTFGFFGPAFLTWRDAAGIAQANRDAAPGGLVDFLLQPSSFISDETPAPSDGPLALFITLEMAQTILGESFADLEIGAAGTPISGTFGFEVTPSEAPARNVIGIIRGSDPVLRNQFVAIGAHSDHIGFNTNPGDHDSLRAQLAVMRPLGAESPSGEPTDEQAVTIAAIIDSLRGVRATIRLDSISNGADDDGSGSVTLLEIAQAFTAAPVKPKRSILIVFHNGEEAGLFGSEYFTDNPTVVRDSIVAALNMDMIGRGESYDLSDAGPGYLQLIGSRRLSTELGDIVESVNTTGGWGFDFDYEYDADGHPSNFYCRSDHANYARYGIPIVFFTTGSHRDYHQVTDEPQYIEYDKMARVGGLVMDIAAAVANLDHRVVVDGNVPEDPHAPCQQ